MLLQHQKQLRAQVYRSHFQLMLLLIFCVKHNRYATEVVHILPLVFSDLKQVGIEIEADAFLQINSRFLFTLNFATLLEKNLLVPAHTPRIQNDSASVNITEEYANGEIGFAINGSLEIMEPDERALNVALALKRQGI